MRYLLHFPNQSPLPICNLNECPLNGAMTAAAQGGTGHRATRRECPLKEAECPLNPKSTVTDSSRRGGGAISLQAFRNIMGSFPSRSLPPLGLELAFFLVAILVTSFLSHQFEDGYTQEGKYFHKVSCPSPSPPRHNAGMSSWGLWVYFDLLSASSIPSSTGTLAYCFTVPREI